MNLLDYVPVIGTAKNIVEAVVALCQGDTATAMEKGGMAVTGLILDVSTGGLGHFAGTTLVRAIEKGAVKIGYGEALYALEKAGVEYETDRGLVEAALRQIRTNKPAVDEEATEKKRSDRGEHVINNNVLKVFKNIIDAFLQGQGTTMGAVIAAGLSSNSRVFRAYDSPMTDADTEFIREVAVARIPATVPYIDANAVLYGCAALILRNDCVSYMNVRVMLTDWERRLEMEVERINHYELYVDRAALDYWSRSRGADVGRYEAVKQRVADMFG